MSIIDGKYHSNLILDKLKIEVDNLKNNGINIKLAIIIVGDHLPSKIYVANKIAKASFVGINTELIELPNEVEEKLLLNKIKSLNENNDVDGIIVQLPLPPHINQYIIQNAIAPEKDVDGLNPINIGLLNSGSKEGMVPCTPLGCMYLIETCIDSLSGKNDSSDW
jgi:methylenetetrahydrofolate dehydrogenase (NADP+)/methenyltetrahydrofolate cyclohydrolase